MRLKPFGPSALTLVALLGVASAASATSMLDWSTITWNPGDLVHTYTLMPDNVDITISISSAAMGTFTTWNGTNGPTCTVATPGKDGPPGPPTYSTNFFGPLLDLGVIYDPNPGGGAAPVLIDIKFTNGGSGAGGPLHPVATLKFEISDIDWSSPGCYSTTGGCGVGSCTGAGLQGWRRDQVVVTADNNGTPVTAPGGFTITPKVAQPTSSVTVGPANTATADGTSESIGEATSSGSDNGSVVVAFGPSFVTHVLLTYNETAFGQPCTVAVSGPGCVGGANTDPGFRGIGILAMTMEPVTLTDFAIE
jgi:hypothetical protein